MRLNTADILKLVPEFMRDDAAVKGLAAAVNALIREPGIRVKTVRVWDQIDQLTHEQLDELAYELDIDWYDSGLPIETKRKIVKISDLTHSRRGTRWAVEELMSAYFHPSEVVEWYEDNSISWKPYHFVICVTDRDVSDEEIQEFTRIARVAMPVRCRIDGICFSDKYGSTVIAYAGITGAHFFTSTKCGTIPRRATLGGVVDDFGVVVSEETDAFQFDTPNAGTEVAGIFPRRGTLADIAKVAAVASEGSGVSLFDPPLSGDEVVGVIPRRGTLGGEVSGSEAAAGNGSTPSFFTPKLTGTEPKAGTVGGIVSGANASAGETSTASAFDLKHTGDEISGTFPRIGTLGASQSASAAVPVRSSDVQSFDCIKCGTVRCGK